MSEKRKNRAKDRKDDNKKRDYPADKREGNIVSKKDNRSSERKRATESIKDNIKVKKAIGDSRSTKEGKKSKDYLDKGNDIRQRDRHTEIRKSSNKSTLTNKSDIKQKMDRKYKDNKKKVTIGADMGACPHCRECGGCEYLMHSYADELKEKQKTVEKLLKGYCRVDPIIGMKEPEHYRNKVHVVFDHDRKGNPISGVYEEGTHTVIPVESCLIHNKKADEIIAIIRGMLKSFKIMTYDEDTGYGLLRHVLIRTGFSTGEIMVVLVLSSPILPSKNNFVKALLKIHPEITTMVINVNDKKTSMVLGEKEHVIYGKGYIEDRLCDKVFRISPKSFYQVNPAQTEVLYNKAIELAELTGRETVVDAYCGIGTIGIVAADHAKRVIGVELNKDAVKDAKINAKRNETRNIEFYQNDAGDFMAQMASYKETVDLVFMDPPRAGSTEKFLDALVALKPKKVVYISCNPETLERDLKYLTKKGYKAQVAVPVDMFPWTEHVECVVLITKL